ncbi:TauD/TfdA family dioxygenase [Thermoactinospora rubra]|uniref:TauD/TfdA family dioxygenase n=1 Tax=Thermoactinospora rubra TaxID=1088767 RepID=UPI000A10BC99|nr:TauD/TfdA family dioxygenase [Thermoactinospora rubra]
MKIQSNTIGSEIHADPGERLAQIEPRVVVDLLRQGGYVYFTGFQPTLAEFEDFTKRFGTCAGARHVHYPEGGEALGFHAEDAYNPYRPDAIWFLCLFEGSDGGAPTGAVDGVRLLKEMSPRWREFCRANTLRFERHWAQETWQKAVGDATAEQVAQVLDSLPGFTHRFLPDGTLYTCYEAPIVVRTPGGEESFSNTMLQALTEQTFYGMTLGDGSPVPRELAEHAERWALENEIQIGWSAGDVAVIDNHRMMHRRAEYHGKDRDLRARHCENLFGTRLPDDSTPLRAAVKSLIQSDVGLPVAVGPVPATV